MAEGTTSIGKSLHNLNVFLFEKNKKVMYVVALILIPSITYFVFNWEAKNKAADMLGSRDIQRIIDSLGMGGSADYSITSDFIEMEASQYDSPFIGERNSDSYTISSNESRVVKGLDITIAWEDETDHTPRFRRY